MKINKKGLVVIPLLMAVSFGAGFNYGHGGISSGDIAGLVKGEKTENENMDLSEFWEVWNLIDQNYLMKPLDKQKMVYGAISGMVNSLDDPYSTFLTPEENRSLSEDLKGVFGGIGAEVGYRDNAITIVAPLKGSPAEKAGLAAGDKIAEVDGKSTKDLSVDDVVNIIRGKEGTKVKLVIVRGDKALSFEITRDTIVDKTVRWEMKEGGIEIGRAHV